MAPSARSISWENRSWAAKTSNDPKADIIFYGENGTLEIDGSALIAAGVPEGPAVGRGLQEALRRKLDDKLDGRDEELAVALEVARSSDGVA